MKRVLHVVGGMNRAGAETMIMNIYRAIDKSKLQFDFLVYNNEKQDYEDEIIALGGRVIHMPLTPGGLSILKSIRGIRHILKTQGPYCAIHAATLHNSAFALLAAVGIDGCKRVVHSHNTSNVLHTSWATKIYNYVTKQIIRLLGEEFIACGDEAGDYLFGERLFRERGFVINNSVNIDYFFDVTDAEVEKTKNELGLKNELVIGSVARFVEVKNHERMLSIASEMLRQRLNFRMLLVGRGDLEQHIKDEVARLGLEKHVLLLGVRSDIAALMHVMDVFLMPSYFEGNPVTLVEAQAACLPAVISDVITPKIDLGLGLIKRVSLNADDKEWIQNIRDIRRKNISKSEVKRLLSEAGYDLNVNVQKLCNLYIK